MNSGSQVQKEYSNHNSKKITADKSTQTPIMFNLTINQIISNPKALKNNNLTIEIALYRLIFKKYPISFQLLVQNLIFGANSAGFQLTYNKSQLLDIFMNDQKVLDYQIGQTCCKSLIHLIKQTNLSYRFEKALISDKMLAPFLFLLSFNYDYAHLIDEQQEKLVDRADFSTIFQCSQQIIESLYKVYEQNVKKIIQPYSFHHLLYQFVAVRLKMKISQRIKTGCWTWNEGSIQLSQALILQYYIKKQQEENKDRDLKQHFSLLCRNVVNLCDLNYQRKQKLRNQLKRLKEQNKSQEQSQEQIKKISRKFNVREDLTVYQFRRIQNGTGNIMEMQPIRYQRIREYYNYIRHKEQHESIKDIAYNISKKFKEAKIYIDQIFQPELEKNYQIQEKNYVNIVLNAIKRHLIKDEVLFVDSHIFYRKYFNVYNLLSKRELQYSKKLYYEPYSDVIYQYLLGVTSNRILFKKRLSETNNMQSYLQSMAQALNSHNKQLPSVVVIYISFSLQKSQWLILNKLISRMNRLGKQIFLLPVRNNHPNIIQEIQFYLKYQILRLLKLNFDSRLAQQRFEKKIDELLKRIDTQDKISQLTRLIWKDFTYHHQ